MNDVATGATHDALNRLVTHTAAGSLRVTGTVSEAATVTIDGVPATVTGTNEFTGQKPLAAGTNTFSVTARDASGNTTTHAYEVEAAGENQSFTYDANGNMTADGTRTFEWDGKNRLTAVNIGTHRSEFTYDGSDRRSRIVEKESGSTVRDAQLFWAGADVIEERISTGDVSRFFKDGEEQAGVPRFVVRDHLGSVREVTGSSGTVRSRSDYDPFGRQTLTPGSEATTFGFTGHLNHGPSGLLMTQYRAYDSGLGRWLSEDPAGTVDGPNLDAYVANRPLNSVDPDGRFLFVIPAIVAAAAEAAELAAAVTASYIVASELADSLAHKWARKGKKTFATAAWSISVMKR